MAEVKIVTTNGDSLKDAIFKNAATEETILKFMGQSKDQHDEDQDNNNDNAKKSRIISQETRDSAKKSAGYLAGMAGNLTSILTSAYKQEINLTEQITEIASLTGNALGGIVSGLASVTGLFGKIGAKAAKGIQLLTDKAGGGISDLTKQFGAYFKGGIREMISYRDAFQQASAAGAGFGGDLIELKAASGQMRMTIEQFNSVISE